MTAEEIIEQLERLIDEREAFIRADAPVRCGQWLPEDESYDDNVYICSVCGYEFIITAGDLESNELNYCPRCGAKMDDKDINVPTKSGMEGKTMDKISREQWVSVKDRMPEQFQRVLICRRRRYGQLYWDNIVIDLGREVIQNRHGDITHWMPLPKPPEEVRDDG